MDVTPQIALGGPEIIFIAIALILLFGAKKLPQLARGIGESLGEFKKARKEYDDTLEEKSSAEKPPK